MTDTGRTFGGSAGCPCRVVDETGGGGTLNDGIESVGVTDNQLLTTRNDDSGVPIVATITLHLSRSVTVQQISLIGGKLPDNRIPGALNGAAVTIGEATTGRLATLADGTTDVLALGATALATVATDTITLSDFTADLFGFPLDQFNITELVIDGTAASTATTPSELCSLTHSFVSSSARYQALPLRLRQGIDALANAACATLDGLATRLTPAEVTAVLTRYKRAVDNLAALGWLSTDQATKLKGLADQIAAAAPARTG